PPALPPLPTRRSSDLGNEDPNKTAANTARNVSRQARSVAGYAEKVAEHYDANSDKAAADAEGTEEQGADEGTADVVTPAPAPGRSEEHTSELQSRENL